MSDRLSQVAIARWGLQVQEQQEALRRDYREKAINRLGEITNMHSAVLEFKGSAYPTLGGSEWLDSFIINADDLDFVCQVRGDDSFVFNVLKQCPFCAEAVAVNPPFKDLASLGRTLREGTPFRHHCQPASPRSVD